VARARATTEEQQSLYEQDFNLWLEQQAALLPRAARPWV
jgi:hypothetical protein